MSKRDETIEKIRIEWTTEVAIKREGHYNDLIGRAWDAAIEEVRKYLQSRVKTSVEYKMPVHLAAYTQAIDFLDSLTEKGEE